MSALASSEPILDVRSVFQALRRRRSPEGCLALASRGRSRGAGGRQRRRQIDPHEDDLRGLPGRRRRGPPRRQSGPTSRPPRRRAPRASRRSTRTWHSPTTCRIGANIFLGREPMRRALRLPADDRPPQDGGGRQGPRWPSSISTSDRLDAPVGRFSGGQRQAVAIGRAIYWNARVILMDEPTAALGVPEQRKVIALIKMLKSQGRGVLFISHNLQDIFRRVGSDRRVAPRAALRANGGSKIPATMKW